MGGESCEDMSGSPYTKPSPSLLSSLRFSRTETIPSPSSQSVTHSIPSLTSILDRLRFRSSSPQHTSGSSHISMLFYAPAFETRGNTSHRFVVHCTRSMMLLTPTPRGLGEDWILFVIHIADSYAVALLIKGNSTGLTLASSLSCWFGK